MPAASKIIKILHLKRHTRKALKRWKMENGKYKKSVQQCNNDNKIIHFHFFYMKRTYFAIAMDSDIRKSLSVQKITNAYVKEIRFAYNVTGSTYSKKFFELCISQGYIQNFERNWKNSVCIRISNLAKFANF